MNFVKALQYSVLIAFIVSFNSLQAQISTQKQLEEKKALLNKELKVINALLFTNKQRKTEAFNDVENLNYKIERKQELIKLTNQQINLLNQEIANNSKSLEKLETDLFEVKEAYKEMILKSFKSKSGKNRLMFILSSETFFQALKRTQYIKQYSIFRKNQAKKIELISQQLNEIKKELLYKRDDKNRFTNKKQSNSKNIGAGKKRSKQHSV